MDDELDELRKKRLQELQQQQIISQGELDQQEEQRKTFDEQRRQILRAILTNEARERLGRIRVARPEVAESIENQLIILAQSGRLQNKINDTQLRELLQKMLPKKRDIKIRRR